ncbi:MAG: aldo/keto reductase [Gammaproteobacteria bacterium]
MKQNKQGKRFQEYLDAVSALNEFAKTNYQKNVLALAVRWVLDKGHTIALWGARHPSQLDNINDAMGWSLDAEALQQIDQIIDQYVKTPVGPEFMAPPA